MKSLSVRLSKGLLKKIRKQKALESKFWEITEIFIVDPFDARLKTHKLSGNLKELWSFSIEYDIRVVFYFAEENRAVFVSVEKHDEVY